MRNDMVENPIGVSGLVLAFLISVVNLGALLWSWDAEVTAAISVVLGAAVAMVSEIVRRLPKPTE